MKETVTGQNVLLELKKNLWFVLVLIVADSASVMRSEKMRLSGLLKNKLQENHDFSMSAILYIIHQEALGGKRLKVQDAMNDLVKTINLCALEV